MTASDCWAQWLATRRFGGDEQLKQEVVARLTEVRDRVLQGARLSEHDTLLDVGCGEGLIGFGALDRCAEVVFSDISQDLLDFCRTAAEAAGVEARCRFVRAPADDLWPIGARSVDAVATRSVLIYVADKGTAFREFFRVLRPGGRTSLYEPINRFGQSEWRERFGGFDVAPVQDAAAKVRALFDELQPESDPMVDFDERDLLAACEQAGFFPVELELHAEIRQLEPRAWDAFANTAWNPRIPTLVEAMDQALDADEQRRFTDHLRPLIEAGSGTWRMAHAYLRAGKPEA